MRVAIGADHGGFVLKEHVKAYLKDNGHEVIDIGNRVYNPNDDFPDFTQALVSAIVSLGCEKGILFCKTGIGTCIAANRHPDIRAAECESLGDVMHARKQLDINVMTIGASKVRAVDAKLFAKAFLSTEALGGRYARRRHKINNKTF